jgi:hypothetical protein
VEKLVDLGGLLLRKLGTGPSFLHSIPHFHLWEQKATLAAEVIYSFKLFNAHLLNTFKFQESSVGGVHLTFD